MSAVPHQAQSNHLLQPDNAGHFSHGLYGDMRSSQTPPASANASPRFSAISPTSQPRQVASHYEPSDRNPPARDVSDETIDDAYAAFILYCNPNFPTTIDTSELVKLFRTPPKSDGNAFSTWTLFELIRKFEAKEIKTWTQLALDLGVKPPNTDEGQSTQKVQQYSVRLKRWMRAMHIDAFFEYLMGKQHPYCLQIPPPHDPFPPQGRDGVILEEDLAIRALDPKFKPKRGRRKADDGEDDIDFDEGTPARKRPQLDTSIPFGNVLQPQSAYPTSAHPNNMHGGFLTQDPWTSVSAVTPSSALTAASAPSRLGHSNLTPYSASPMSGQQIRWRLNTENPQTPHPLSAVTPQSAYPFFDEPQSAVTPSSSRSRSRRRHGPAVSSAWSTNNSSSTGKLRGRPPSNRSIRDGPYVTFPANPKTKEEPPIDRNPGNLTPIVERAHSDPPAPENSFRFPPTPASAISPSKMEGPLPGGMPQKQRLSLQVPPNVGNPVVRLVTPTVLVNGEENQSPGTGLGPSPISAASAQVTPAHTYDQQSMYEKQGRPTHQTYHGALTPSETPAQPRPPPPTRSQTELDLSAMSPIPSIPLETLNRALAAELIRAPLGGRRKRLRGNEAKTLASAILQPLYAKPSSGPSPAAKVMSDQALSIAISSCLGLTSTVGFGLGGPTGGVRRVDCIRFRVGGDGYESPIDDEDEEAETSNDAQGSGRIKETFDVLFAVSFGGLSGEWIAKGLEASNESEADAESRDRGRGSKDTEGARNETNDEHWKSKYLEAQRKIWEMKEEVKSLKDRVLEAVL
ncbi:Abp2 multi-domain protein [Pyrenophora tritici-repentis]|nr:Abp2 multi-domain protein [Pyrenophora tritici-repentis]KAG9384790.1 Abp2 multi-domain protein [Pyrenophora tritici-repentis]KAI0573654.1 Abp2 multi-domain protein [Pyrenophora tritici-repentis]KAI1525342.1 Abp2 domain containing protein [Pyrenophora tritici-repentis]KAI1561256.1 Abp2 domain containing protein [Pyrenophora tritici-repentis]